MKRDFILAAAGFAGLVNGGVHSLKLQKIPLSEQLEHADITTQAKGLYKKYAGQRFMGVRPNSHREEMFKETSIHLDQDDHPVPVSNFLNAQCSYRLRFRILFI
jgi:saccharopepsin